MKTIKDTEDLGISQWPWSNDGLEGECCQIVKIRDKNGNEIAQSFSSLADAKLIAASPLLYTFLNEAVYDVCGHCKSGGIEHNWGKLENGFCYDDARIAECKCNYGTCHIQRWRRILEEIAIDQSANE